MFQTYALPRATRELIAAYISKLNVCTFCGMGDECETSGMKSGLFPPETKVCDVKYVKVEDQNEVWEEASKIGRLIGERLK